MAYPGARIPEIPLIGSSMTVAATIADRGMDKSPCSAPAFSAVDSRTVTVSGAMVMVGICLVLHLDGRHRSTVEAERSAPIVGHPSRRPGPAGVTDPVKAAAFALLVTRWSRGSPRRLLPW